MPSLQLPTIAGMNVFVVSRSRFDRSYTLESLGLLSDRVTLIVPMCQTRDYSSLSHTYGCRVRGCADDGISLTRQFCGKIAQTEKFVMFDDDLKFYHRVSATDWHLKYPIDLNLSLLKMFALIAQKLTEYAHVSVSPREGNNRMAYPGIECTRPLRLLAYRKKEFLQLKHGRVKIMEDFDVTLQLLRKGFKNYLITEWAQGQIETQMKGGCSDYRTHELHATNVQLFAKLHAPFVRLREKHNKSGGEFGTRLEAMIYWKKAYESSIKNPAG